MNFGVQFKVRGESFGGHFINGMSMGQSERICHLDCVFEDEEKTVYMSGEEYRITA